MPKGPTSAGRMKARVRFDKRGAVPVTSPASTDYGNEEGDWAEQFTRWADVKPLKGGEGVVGMRLTGKQPAIIIVRRDSETKTITTDWRAVEILPDATTRLYNIRGFEDMERDNRFVTLICERGVADG